MYSELSVNVYVILSYLLGIATGICFASIWRGCFPTAKPGVENEG